MGRIEKRPTAKIYQADLPRRILRVGDQNVVGFQVLVQDSKVVSCSHRSCCRGYNLEPCFKRDRLQAALLLGPVGQVRPSKFALQKKRAVLKVPFQKPLQTRDDP